MPEASETSSALLSAWLTAAAAASRSCASGRALSTPWRSADRAAAAWYSITSGRVKASSSSARAASAPWTSARRPFSSGAAYHCSARAASSGDIRLSSACRVESRTGSGRALSTPPCWIPTSTMSEVYPGRARSQLACTSSSATTARMVAQCLKR